MLASGALVLEIKAGEPGQFACTLRNPTGTGFTLRRASSSTEGEPVPIMNLATKGVSISSWGDAGQQDVLQPDEVWNFSVPAFGTDSELGIFYWVDSDDDSSEGMSQVFAKGPDVPFEDVKTARETPEFQVSNLGNGVFACRFDNVTNEDWLIKGRAAWSLPPVQSHWGISYFGWRDLQGYGARAEPLLVPACEVWEFTVDAFGIGEEVFFSASRGPEGNRERLYYSGSPYMRSAGTWLDGQPIL